MIFVQDKRIISMYYRNMNNIRVSIDIRIEADSESRARRYAVKHGFDAAGARWSKNHESDGGRLYIVFTSLASISDGLSSVKAAQH